MLLHCLVGQQWISAAAVTRVVRQSVPIRIGHHGSRGGGGASSAYHFYHWLRRTNLADDGSSPTIGCLSQFSPDDTGKLCMYYACLHM